MPQSRSQAWNLAHLDSELSVAEHASQSDTLQDILVRAANIVGRSSVSAEELHSMYSRIVELESHQGIYARVTGIFTFVNFIWLVSTIFYYSTNPCTDCNTWYLYFYSSCSVCICTFPQENVMVFMERSYKASRDAITSFRSI